MEKVSRKDRTSSLSRHEVTRRLWVLELTDEKNNRAQIGTWKKKIWLARPLQRILPSPRWSPIVLLMATNGSKKRRPENEPSLDLIPAKRPKVGGEENGGALIQIPQVRKCCPILTPILYSLRALTWILSVLLEIIKKRDADRTSDLAAPNLLLTGHQVGFDTAIAILF